ncbi:hypothetical protein PR003_g28184 [Phytophthora rubi]|uniref:RxLR effector protein n=1 Tax=Phytophthora rubi TaxID=129364 RepID=A0A6A3KC46_9STRA|nr:hypothetical protein PR001_g20522 [Phytophthora rubi]KAE9001604.1 hypothetical protein PR002_g17871 [Phytophthora rubi]KAE9279623.1 hypothetical protein PR003_g28184 [Phytophthora rubi]
MIADPATAPDAIQSPNEVQHDGKRFLRTPGAEANEEERGWSFSSTTKLSAGAEKLSKKQLKALVDNTVRNPQFYDDLARRMKKAGYGGENYKRFVADYAKFLSGDIRIQ